MADDKPSKPGLAGFMAGFQQGLAAGDIGAVDVSSAAIREALQRMQTRPATTAEILDQQARDLEPASVGGDKSDESPAPKRIRSTRTKHRPGVLRVKEYPVAEDRLDSIGILRASATFWLAVGSLAFGFALSCWQSLSLAGNDVTETAKATWTVYRNVSFAVAAVCYLAGGYYFLKGNSVVKFIKRHTIHDPME